MKNPQNSQSQISQDKNSKNEDSQNKNLQNKNSKNPNEIDISALNNQNLSQKDFSVQQLEKAGVIVKIKIGKMTYIVAEIAFFLLLAIFVMLAILADKSRNSAFLIFSVVMIFFIVFLIIFVLVKFFSPLKENRGDFHYRLLKFALENNWNVSFNSTKLQDLRTTGALFFCGKRTESRAKCSRRFWRILFGKSARKMDFSKNFAYKMEFWRISGNSG